MPDKIYTTVAAPSQDIFRSKSLVPVADSQLTNIHLNMTPIASSDGEKSPGDAHTVAFSENEEPAAKISFATSMPKKDPRNSNKTRRKSRFSRKIKKALAPSIKNGSIIDDVRQPEPSSPGSVVTQATLCTSFDAVNDYRMTSAEQDPSPFQVELPTKKEFEIQSKICTLMNSYTAIHRDFDFASLSGLPHSFLEQEYAKSTTEQPLIAGSCHRDLVQKLLACSDDIVVEGFFREYEYTDEENDNDKKSERMEACILSSDSLRQIIVCFRGSMALGKSNLSGKEPQRILHAEQSVPIMGAFRAAYFGTPIEQKVFALLANVTARKPFFDVVMTGHSFCAAVATIAGLRYASANSAMRVSCHVFGSPKIGGEEWRRTVHSTPNLRVCRAENGCDPYVSLPKGDGWVHCGHAIRMKRDGADAEFEARRFDRDRPSAATGSKKMFGFVQARARKGKVDHKIQSYEKKLTSSGDGWIKDFCEMKGDGIQADNERRLLA